MQNVTWKHVIIVSLQIAISFALVFFAWKFQVTALWPIAVAALASALTTMAALTQTAPKDVPIIAAARRAGLVPPEAPTRPSTPNSMRGFAGVGLLVRLSLVLVVTALVLAPIAYCMAGCSSTPAVIQGIEAGIKVSATACEEFVDDSSAPDWVKLVCKDVETGATFTMYMPRKQWRAMQTAAVDAGRGGL